MLENAVLSMYPSFGIATAADGYQSVCVAVAIVFCCRHFVSFEQQEEIDERRVPEDEAKLGKTLELAWNLNWGFAKCFFQMARSGVH